MTIEIENIESLEITEIMNDTMGRKGRYLIIKDKKGEAVIGLFSKKADNLRINGRGDYV
jgi:hypothetical protein